VLIASEIMLNILIHSHWLIYVASFRSQSFRQQYPLVWRKSGYAEILSLSSFISDDSSRGTANFTSNESVPRKLPIGSSPQFSLPSDSVEETLFQRFILWLHFTLVFYNLYLSVPTSITISLIPTCLQYIAIFVGSFILGDFAVSDIIPPMYCNNLLNSI
jgi:hypothetical protein